MAHTLTQCQTVLVTAFLTQSGLRCLPICQDQMTQHHFETRTEPQPLPVYQIWKWDKSMQGFHLKRNLLKGSTTVSRKSTAVRQLLPSSPPMCYKMTKAADLKPRQIVLLQRNTVTRHNRRLYLSGRRDAPFGSPVTHLDFPFVTVTTPAGSNDSADWEIHTLFSDNNSGSASLCSYCLWWCVNPLMYLPQLPLGATAGVLTSEQVVEKSIKNSSKTCSRSTINHKSL